MMISLKLIGVLCLTGVMMAHPNQRAKRAAGCDYQGGNYDDGQEFSTSGSGPCVKYLCSAGSVTIKSKACQQPGGGACAAFGTTKTSLCKKSVCGEDSAGRIGFHTVAGSEYGCADKDGKCGYKNGSTVSHVINGKVYNCKCYVSGNTVGYKNCSG